jgi:hypothetical protein
MRSNASWLALSSALVAACSTTHPAAHSDAGPALTDASAAPDAHLTEAADAQVSSPDAAPIEAPPRLLWPPGTSTVTSRRPTLRWTGSAGAEVRVELCRERACTAPLEVLTTTEESARPSRDLEPGWVFWRVRSGARTSATWQLRVGVRSAAVDTAWGVALDVNGDGYLDEVREQVRGGLIDSVVFHGTADGFEAAPAVTIPPTDCAAPSLAASVGDLNGDGFADLAIAENQEWCRPGRVRLFLGGPDGVSSTPHRVLEGTRTAPGFGGSVIGAGDLDGDGHGDIAITDRVVYYLAPLTAEIWLGSADGITADRGTSVEGGETSLRANGDVLATGDVNGDAISDLMVGPNVYLGSRTGLGPPAFHLPREVKSMATGDVNGDGYADWAVGSDVIDPGIETARVSVLHGGPVGLGGAPATLLVGADQYYASDVVLEDLNGDGFDDLTVSSAHGAPEGRYSGSPAGLVIE